MKKSITTDNGSENINRKEVTRMLRMLMYFCHAYHSWEKGTVENMNERIRRYIPKGKSIDLLTTEEIMEVEYALNHTPSKYLGFLTPREAIAKAMDGEQLTINKRVVKLDYQYEQASQRINSHPLRNTVAAFTGRRR